MNMLSQETANRGVEQIERQCIHGVGSFTNHGHVNLLILSASDPDQVRKIMQEVLKGQHSEKAR